MQRTSWRPFCYTSRSPRFGRGEFTALGNRRLACLAPKHQKSVEEATEVAKKKDGSGSLVFKTTEGVVGKVSEPEVKVIGRELFGNAWFGGNVSVIG